MTPDLCNAQSFPQATFYMASNVLQQRSQYSCDGRVSGLGFSWPNGTPRVANERSVGEIELEENRLGRGDVGHGQFLSVR